MAEYEALIQNLRSIDEYDTGYAKLIYDAADAIEELTAQTRWIPVTERLPEVDKNVLVFACGNEITIGRMKRQTENGYHVFIICHGIARELARPGRITHWMPLPEPPKEGE